VIRLCSCSDRGADTTHRTGSILAPRHREGRQPTEWEDKRKLSGRSIWPNERVTRLSRDQAGRMNNSTDRRLTANPWQPRGPNAVGAAIIATVGWLLTIGCLIGFIVSVPDVGRAHVGYLPVLCSAPQAAIWATRQARAVLRLRATVPLVATVHHWRDTLPGATKSAPSWWCMRSARGGTSCRPPGQGWPGSGRTTCSARSGSTCRGVRLRTCTRSRPWRRYARTVDDQSRLETITRATKGRQPLARTCIHAHLNHRWHSSWLT
jgi:hypothetical protein